MSSKNSKNKVRSNKEITAHKVRFVDQEGEMQGVMSLVEALAKAKQAGLDLVEISPQADPPVCKLMDFGRFKYEQKKKMQGAKKKQKTVSLKEIKLRPNIGRNDLDVKLRHLQKFIEAGNKVKVTLWFRGREIVHNDLGRKLLQQVLEETAEFSKPEVLPKMEGRHLMMMLAPNK